MPSVYRPREWPTIHKNARDGAADEVAAALNNTIPLAEVEQDPEALRRITRTVYHLQNALRHLESAGAQTRPASQ